MDGVSRFSFVCRVGVVRRVKGRVGKYLSAYLDALPHTVIHLHINKNDDEEEEEEEEEKGRATAAAATDNRIDAVHLHFPPTLRTLIIDGDVRLRNSITSTAGCNYCWSWEPPASLTHLLVGRSELFHLSLLPAGLQTLRLDYS